MLCDSNPAADLFFLYQRPDDWKPQRYHFNASFQHSVAPTENENFKPINLNTNIHGKHSNQIENNLFMKDINWSEGVFGCEQKRETAGRRNIFRENWPINDTGEWLPVDYETNPDSFPSGDCQTNIN